MEFVADDEILHGKLKVTLVGPGAYNVPNLMGSRKFLTSYNNTPSYTMSGRNISQKQFISKKHCIVHYELEY